MDRRSFQKAIIAASASAALPMLGATACVSSPPPKAVRQRVVWRGSGKRVVGYVTNWAQRRPFRCKFDIDDIDGTLLTHLVYAYARIDPDLSDEPSFELAPAELAARDEMTMRSRTTWQPPRGDMGPDGQYERLSNLKKKYPHLKTLLAIGGKNPDYPPQEWGFAALAENPKSRQRFVQHTMRFLRNFGFDGMSLDWAYATEPTRPWQPSDGKNFTALCQEFKLAARLEAQKSGKPELLLTMAAGPKQARTLQLGELGRTLDWIQVMAYDFGAGDPTRTCMHAPLHEPEGSKHGDVTRTMRQYLAGGVPNEKLVLGMPTYGRGWEGVTQRQPNGPATGAGPESFCTQQEGLLAFYEIEKLIESGEYAAYWDEASGTPYAYDAEGKHWYSYDDVRSFGLKVDLIEREGLGGAMFWSLDLDDFRNGYPLISSVSRRLRGGPTEAGIQEVRQAHR